MKRKVLLLVKWTIALLASTIILAFLYFYLFMGDCMIGGESLTVRCDAGKCDSGYERRTSYFLDRCGHSTFHELPASKVAEFETTLAALELPKQGAFQISVADLYCPSMSEALALIRQHSAQLKGRKEFTAMPNSPLTPERRIPSDVVLDDWNSPCFGVSFSSNDVSKYAEWREKARHLAWFF